MDRIVGIIPENEEIQSNSPIDYAWKKEAIVRRIDNVALSTAGDLHFDTSPDKTLSYVLMGFIPVALMLGFWTIRRRTK